MKLDKTVFALHKCIRERYLQYLEGFSLEQLAVIPEGFRNNLLWNISHAIVTQQLYCYYNSGLPMYVSEDFIAAYRKGTVPDGHIPTQEEVDTLKKLLISTQEQDGRGLPKRDFYHLYRLPHRTELSPPLCGRCYLLQQYP